MTLVSKSIPNLINGVSQQPDALRLSSQAEIAENVYPSVVEGLKKRPAAQFYSKLTTALLKGASIYLAKPSSTEKYFIIMTSGEVEVYDLEGNPKTVNVAEGASLNYLDCTDPEADLRLAQVASYTFIANRMKKVDMDVATSPERGPEAILFVKQGSEKQNYKVWVDDVLVCDYTLPSNPSTIAAVAIDIEKEMAESLATTVDGEGNITETDWDIQRQASVIWIRRKDGGTFSVKTEDARNGDLMEVFTKKSQKFSELPTVAPTGYTVEIIGDNTSNFDNYYVQFEPTNDGEDFDSGVWKETVAPSIPYKLLGSTMPHALVREADGSFTFKEVEWGERIVGDVESAPDPTFVGKTIKDIFYYGNRLGFLSDENACMSTTGEFFDFFPATVTTLTDDQPLDLPASSPKVSLLNHAVPFQDDLLFFSNTTQFILDEGDVLSPRYSRILPVTDFESSPDTSPVNSGKNIFFAVNKGSYSGVREYYYDEDSGRDAIDITAHVPKFIDGRIKQLRVSTAEDVLVALSDTDTKAVYIYKYYWAGNEKMQSAWVKWTFDRDILAVEFDEEELLMVTQGDDGTYLEKVSLQPGYEDVDADFEYRLDRKVDETQCTTSYDSNLDHTTWTLPYSTATSKQVVVRPPKAHPRYIPGMNLSILSQTNDSVTVAGDFTGVPVFIGLPYIALYRFSKQVIKEDADGGGKSIVGTGTLRLRRWSIEFHNTGYFRAEVTPDYRETETSVFTGRILGAGSNTIGRIPISDGRFRFPVLSKSDRVTIDLINDSFLPSSWLSADWEGTYTIRSRRI